MSTKISRNFYAFSIAEFKFELKIKEFQALVKKPKFDLLKLGFQTGTNQYMWC